MSRGETSGTDVPRTCLRFRHPSGTDIGPFTFLETAGFTEIREKLFAEWPKEGPMSTEAPLQASDIKLILSGKFIDASAALKDYKKDMGEITADTIVTFHVIVRPSSTPKKTAGAATPAPKAAEEPASQGCSCAVS